MILMPEGWLSTRVSSAKIFEARATRARRDKTFGYNKFEPTPGRDTRLYGDLGEMVFDEWLDEVAHGDYEWLDNPEGGEPDFVIYGKTVEMKTGPLPCSENYNCQVNQEQAETSSPAEHLFFATYDASSCRLWLIGGIPFWRFMDIATYHPVGEQYTSNYVIPEGRDCYDVKPKHVTPPIPWLDGLRASQVSLF